MQTVQFKYVLFAAGLFKFLMDLNSKKLHNISLRPLTIILYHVTITIMLLAFSI